MLPFSEFIKIILIPILIWVKHCIPFQKFFLPNTRKKANCQILFTNIPEVLAAFTFANSIDSLCRICFGGSNLIFLPIVDAVSCSFRTTGGVVGVVEASGVAFSVHHHEHNNHL